MVSTDERHRIIVDQARTALSLHTLHVRRSGERVCSFCVRPWPCLPARRASLVLGKPSG